MSRRSPKSLAWSVLKRVTPAVTINTKQGRLTVSTRDFVIGRDLFLCGQHEFDFSRRCVGLLKHHGYIGHPVSFLDVGANIGHIGIGLLLAGDIERVIAIEPDPDHAAKIFRNVEQNNLIGKVALLNCAAAATRGELELARHEWNHGDHHIARAGTVGAIRVPALPLDDIVGSVSMLWIDIQGYETEAFKGATRLLTTGIPTVSEVSPFCMQRAGIDPGTFAEIAHRYWTHYFVPADDGFIKHPLSHLQDLVARFDPSDEQHYVNVVLVRDALGTSR